MPTPQLITIPAGSLQMRDARTGSARVVTLEPREGFVVPRGVRHRTRAPERAVILMVETASIIPTGG